MSSKKISEFLSDASFVSGDYLTIIRGNTNYKILVDALAPFMGAIGTINIVGGTGTPALEKPNATTNNVRTIEVNTGIKSAISPQNGVLLELNIVNGTLGNGEVALIADLTQAQYILRTIKGVNGVSASLNGTVIEVSGQPVQALLSLQGNSNQTVITAINTPVLANATWVSEAATNATAATSGRITYTSAQSIKASINLDVKIKAVSGSINATVSLAKNGTVVANSGRKIAITTTSESYTNIAWASDMAVNDYFEVWLENNTDSSNLILESGAFRVS